MKNFITKAISLGLGIGVTGKEQVEKMVAELQKKTDLNKKESRKIINEMIQKGEKVRVNLDKEINKRVKEVVKLIEPVVTIKSEKPTPKKSAKKTAKKKTAKKKSVKRKPLGNKKK